MAGINSKQILLTIKPGRPGNDLQKETVVPTCLNNFKDLADNSRELFNCSPQKARGQANDLWSLLSFILDSVTANSSFNCSMIYFTYNVNMIHSNWTEHYCQGWSWIELLPVFYIRQGPCLLFKLAFHATTNSNLVMIQARNSNFIYMMSYIEWRAG